MYSIYEIKQGETLNDIANKLNITIEQLNSINGDLRNLSEGQLIVIPNEKNYTLYVVKPGDTLYSIAKKNNTDVKSIELFNGLKENEFLYPNQELMIPKNNIYITKENENLLDIIKKLNIEINEFLKLNNKIYLQEDQILYYKKD